jgi:hypothetical protein
VSDQKQLGEVFRPAAVSRHQPAGGDHAQGLSGILPRAAALADAGPADDDEGEVDFRPIGPGYVLVLRHPHSSDERRPLLGWTRRGSRWLPTFWMQDRLIALDPQSPSFLEDPDHVTIEVLFANGKTVDLTTFNGHAGG